jgi:hypothetical protein
METTEGSAAPESTPAPAAGGEPSKSELSESRYSRARVEEGAPPRPRSGDPAPGLLHIYDEKTGVWVVRRDPDYREPGSEEESQPQQQRPTPDAKPGAADETGGLQLAEHLPTIIREDPSAPTVLREASEALDHVRMEPAAKQRLVDLAADLHAADLEAGVPPLWNEEACLGVLRQRWGAAFPERLTRAQAAAKALGPKFLAWCGTDYRGNSPALLETLAIMADKEKLLGLSPEQAAAKMKEWRTDPKSPLRNSLHPEHAVALAKARVLAIISEGKGRQGNVEELVKDRQEAEAKAKGEPAVDDATAKLKAEEADIRRQPEYFRPGKNPELHRSLTARMVQIMRELYKD